MLEIKELTFSYDKAVILEDISISSSRGEFIGIIGPNGAGKSTLIKIIDGILKAKQGQVIVDGHDINTITRRELAKTVAYLPQESKFAFNYTVREVVLMGRFPYLQGVWAYKTADYTIVNQMMRLMEIDQFADRQFNALSGGEKQRVLIASALAQQPKMILLDEPTSALDLHHQIAIYQIFKKLQHDQKLTIIVITHDINLAAQFCDRMIMIGNGRLISDGTPDKVLQFQLLQDTFGVNVYIDINPLTKSLYILPYGLK